MRWLVTGGAGFIGSHLVDAILDRGLGEVVVLDSFRRGRREFLARHEGNPALTILEGDIRDAAAVRDALRGCDTVVHLAARSNVMGSEADVQDACESNVAGTVNVLDAALKAGVRNVVFSSSREVYGDPPSLPVAEDAPLAPKNLYGASKAAGETYCSVFRQRGLDIRILRLSNVYGRRDTERVIPLWFERAEDGRPLEVFGGKQVLDLIWIDFVVEALVKAALGPPLPQPVNVGSGRGIPILELARRLIEVTGSRSAPVFLPAREQEVLGYTADVTAMRTVLGIEPPPDPLVYLASMAGPKAVSTVG